MLLLGARMSDEPYSATDRRLLEGIASQIGLVYENQHLRERVRREPMSGAMCSGGSRIGASAC